MSLQIEVYAPEELLVPHTLIRSPEAQPNVQMPRDATAWARLQLSIGAAACEITQALDMSFEAATELQTATLEQAARLSIDDLTVLNRSLDGIALSLHDHAGQNRQQNNVSTRPDLVLLKSPAIRDRGHLPYKKAPRKRVAASERRIKTTIEAELIAPQKGLSNTEILETMVEGASSDQKIATLIRTAERIMRDLGQPDLWDENTNRRMVLLMRSKVALDERSDISPNPRLNKLYNRTLDEYLDQNGGIVNNSVKDLSNPSSILSAEDLFAEGNAGFIESLKRFDLGSTSAKVVTYCAHRIRGSALDAIRYYGNTIRLSRGDLKRAMYLQEAMNMEGEIDLEAVAADLDCSVESLQRSYSYFVRAQTLSLDAPIGHDDADVIDLANSVADLSSDVEMQALGQVKQRTEIDDLIDRLPEKERKIVKMRFGYPPYKLHSLNEIAAEFGFTESRASQIVGETLTRLYQLLPADIKRIRPEREMLLNLQNRVKEDQLIGTE